MESVTYSLFLVDIRNLVRNKLNICKEYHIQPSEIDRMPFYEYEHIPGIDYLGRNLVNDMSPRQLGSVCAQLGKKKAITENFDALNDIFLGF